MSSTYNQVSMTSTAAIIIASSTARYRLLLKNTGSNTVFIGKNSSVVDTANNANGGFPLKAGRTLSLSDIMEIYMEYVHQV